LVIFLIGSCFYVQAGLDHHPPVYASLVDGMTGMRCHAKFLIFEMRFLSLGLASNHDPLDLLLLRS
jgi:hypothetical protein